MLASRRYGYHVKVDTIVGAQTRVPTWEKKSGSKDQLEEKNKEGHKGKGKASHKANGQTKTKKRRATEERRDSGKRSCQAPCCKEIEPLLSLPAFSCEEPCCNSSSSSSSSSNATKVEAQESIFEEETAKEETSSLALLPAVIKDAAGDVQDVPQAFEEGDVEEGTSTSNKNKKRKVVVNQMKLTTEEELCSRPQQKSKKWLRIAIVLAIFTITYNLLEAGVSITLGALGGSLSLLGFGSDSLVEVSSAILVLWRITGEENRNEAQSLKRERIATLLIGLLTTFLGVSTIGAGIAKLILEEEPESGVAGLIISSVSLSFMFFLWYCKRYTARKLDSATLESDSMCSLGCIKLSVILFGGSLLFMLSSSLWWVDSAAAILMALFIALEGVQTSRAALRKDFAGSCGCINATEKNKHRGPAHYLRVFVRLIFGL
ncbi:Transmembrane protein 163 [Balamuthia mandrillaris]